MFSKIDNAKTQMGVSWCHVLRSCHIDNLKRVVVTSALSIELKWFFFFFFAMQTAKELLFTFYKLSKQ